MRQWLAAVGALTLLGWFGAAAGGSRSCDGGCIRATMDAQNSDGTADDAFALAEAGAGLDRNKADTTPTSDRRVRARESNFKCRNLCL